MLRPARFRAADRVTSDEAGRAARRRARRRLRRAHVGHGARLRAGVDCGGDLSGDLRDRCSDDRELGLGERFGDGCTGPVDSAPLGRDLERVTVRIEPGDGLDARLLRRQPDRGSDEPGSDDRQPLDCHYPMRLPMTSTIAVTAAANSANSLVGICCGPSESACSG